MVVFIELTRYAAASVSCETRKRIKQRAEGIFNEIN